MTSKNTSGVEESRKQLVERVASSSYFSKSARLRDMLLYLCERTLDHGVGDIHEQEVGHKVFGRPADYDTSADNIVRVHASTLRKRIEQYFANEGAHEPIVIDIPRGNYAPVFHKRATAPPVPHEPAPVHAPAVVEPEAPVPSPPSPAHAAPDWKFWVPVALAVVFACLAAFAFLHPRVGQSAVSNAFNEPSVRQLWSQVLQANRPTDIVLDDASLAFFQEVSARQITLAEYFDRSYLRTVEENANAAKLDREVAKSLILKRQSSYADVALASKLGQISTALKSELKTNFARDYSFRELKADNVILLGNTRSNPWIEPFENHMSVRWNFDPSLGTYYPVDKTSPSADLNKFRITAEAGKPHEGYASIAFLPNLSGTGKVLILSATGGSAVTAALDFLSDERSVSQLRSQLPQAKSSDFPYFEALLKIGSRASLPRDTAIVFCRQPQP